MTHNFQLTVEIPPCGPSRPSEFAFSNFFGSKPAVGAPHHRHPHAGSPGAGSARGPEKEAERGAGGERKGGEEREREEGRGGGAQAGRPRRPGGGPSPTRDVGRAHLPGSSWRTRRAPSWTCSPPASSRSPTFSCARAPRAAPPPLPRRLRLRLGWSLRLRAPPRAPAAPPWASPPPAPAQGRGRLPPAPDAANKGPEPGPPGPPRLLTAPLNPLGAAGALSRRS